MRSIASVPLPTTDHRNEIVSVSAPRTSQYNGSCSDGDTTFGVLDVNLARVLSVGVADTSTDFVTDFLRRLETSPEPSGATSVSQFDESREREAGGHTA